MQADNRIFVLTGPTASGKTALAVRWAEANRAEIISADALLFYRGMDIGTAKPTPEERARVPHHLVDIAPVREPLNVRRYVDLALEAVRDIQGRGKRVLVTGGSGFYLKSYFTPVADDTVEDPVVRAEVERLEREGGLAAMLSRLRELNPGSMGNLDIRNPRRVARALERCITSGKTLVVLEYEFSQALSPFAPWEKHTVLLQRSKESLEERIYERTAAMIEAGLIEEVARLQKQGLEQNPSAARAIGYRETLHWLDHGSDVSELEEAINVSTRQLVAKQFKWFRTQLEPDRIVDLDEGEPELADLFA